ncbi:hypothetical protein J6590_048618 [Homalodisca vitripennis]|nr:hypothetical protein J6590_048618 [Homalodisca vitripennis]
MVSTCDLRFPIRLENLNQMHGQFSRSGKSGKSQGKKQDWKSGNPVSSQGKVREFRRWSGKNIKSLYTNKLTAAAPSPSLQTTRRMKQKPWGLRRKKSGKNEKFGLEIREKSGNFIIGLL